MAFPKFQREGAPRPQWQGRQPKQYFVPGEVGFVVRNGSLNAGIGPDVSTFILNELTGKPSAINNPTIQPVITALQNKNTHRVSGLPGVTTLFVPVLEPILAAQAAQQNPNPDETPAAPLNDRALLDAINQINDEFYKTDPTSEDNAATRIAAAMPNWLSGAQQGIAGGTGGPGGLPVLANASSAGLNLPADASAKLEDDLDEFVRKHASQVNVYILDTAPSVDDIEAQRAKFDSLGNTLVPLVFGAGNVAAKNTNQNEPYKTMLSWGDQFSIHYDMTRDPNPPNRLLMDILVNRQPVARKDAKLHVDGGYYVPGHDYDMSDHGLFIASLIAQQYHNFYANIQAGLQVNAPAEAETGAAPPLKIHLIQVLSNFGVGTIETFINGLAKVMELQADQESPAVINCSWVLSAPTQLEHMAYLIDSGVGLSTLEHSFLDALALANNQTLQLGTHFYDSVDYLRGILALREHLGFLRQNNEALVIACAGNDRVGTNPRPSARHPAAYEEVVGVTSLSTPGNINTASYANIADDPSNIGFAVWGGDNTTTGITVEDETIYFTDPNNSLVGLYFDDTFPDALGNKNDDPAADLKKLYFLDQGKPVPAGIAPIVNNTTGLAHWAGTSFATPVMTGLFAATLGWHWDPASNRNFRDAETAITIASNARTLNQELIIPMQ